MRKLIVRADDIGYSDVCNIGSFEAIEKGIVTSADVMFDTPGTVDALHRLKNYPWLSIGWHTHFWGSPILGGERVPSLYDAKRKGFRTDLYTAEDVSYEEALVECRAQMELCVSILGKAPDVGDLMNRVESPFTKALQKVMDEYGIVSDFMGTDLGIPKFLYEAGEKWRSRKIYARGIMEYCRPLKKEPLTACGWTDSITALQDYDPIRFYVEDESHLLNTPEDTISMHAWHPGYIDYYVYRHGDYTPAAYVFKDIRTVDVHALCSEKVRQWIRENKIELVNMRDALYGTREYQNHLKAAGSDLAV
ncbi:MAG: ChbG/HpnK family deacetylase [Eubacteriales bacterium]|nr:ChbG/HpnK family deacetylase [Eubacteriales bacterium]